MVVFPNAKINLGLRIVRKRADGYHDLETVFYPVALPDALEVIRNTSDEKNEFAISYSGIPLQSTNDNLCVRAFHLLKRDFQQIAGIKMHLHKAIPLGAGLGGGSADAAYTLRVLNDLFTLGLSSQQLLDYSLQLGSDCPFFIINKPSYATGRGEILETVGLDLSSYKFVVINPGIHVNTAEAFASINPKPATRNLKEILLEPIHTWKNELQNDFEKVIFAAYPAIAAIKQQLYDKGALYASMSGSGSTVYGIFEKTANVRLALPGHYYFKELLN